MQKDMQNDITEQITYSTVLIRCYDDQDKEYGSGTGFIMGLFMEGNNGHPFIITNKHVIEDSVRTEIELCKADGNGKPIDTDTTLLQIEKSEWFFHREESVDLCCCSLMNVLHENKVDMSSVFFCPLSTSLIPTEEALSSFLAIEEVYMVGYPKGIFDDYNHKPITRKGITASHPKKDYQESKETLLDIAVFPGSSGSPVLLLNSGSCILTLSNLTATTRPFLLGVVYAGWEEDEKEQTRVVNIPVKRDFEHKAYKYFNLAVMIKAEKILDFEKMLKPEIPETETESIPHESAENPKTKE